MKNAVFYGIIAGILAVLGAAIWLMTPKNSIPSTYASVSGSRIYYTGSATKEEASALGEFMHEIRYITDDKKPL